MNTYTFDSLKLVEPNSITRRIWGFTFVVFLFLIILLFLPWQQTVKGQGTLIAFQPNERAAPITATIDGTIETFFVEENQAVARGDKLFTMVDLDRHFAKRIKTSLLQIDTQVTNLDQELILLRSNLADANASMRIGMRLFEQRLLQTQSTLESLRLKQTALRKRFDVERLNFERIKSLYASKIESKRAFDRADATYAAAKADKEKIVIQITIETRNLSIIAQEKSKFMNESRIRLNTLQNTILNVQSRTNALERERQKLRSEAARFERSEVVADKNGRVIRIVQTDKDRFIKRGEPVMQFAPAVSQRALLIKVTDFNMPLIHAGLKVRIMFYGWPALQISGWPRIRFGTFGGIIKKVDPIAHEPGFFYAYVFEDPAEPWPTEQTLRLGTQATVWVALETVTVWYQIWRLMNAFPPKMVIPVQDKP